MSVDGVGLSFRVLIACKMRRYEMAKIDMVVICGEAHR
eukprot:SAG31_NODE_32671_length_353_cov_0.543307_2_plen_37_part_01